MRFTSKRGSFKEAVEYNAVHTDLAKYIKLNGDFDAAKFTQDRVLGHITYTEEQVRAILANLYRLFVGAPEPTAKAVQTPEQSDVEMLAIIDAIPEGVVFKRIFSRKGINRWLVRYQANGTEYYDPTLKGAIDKMMKNNRQLRKRFEEKQEALHDQQLDDHIRSRGVGGIEVA